MGTVRVGMARLWLGWWPLPADEDMALGAGSRALSSGRAGGRRRRRGDGGWGPGLLWLLWRAEGRTGLGAHRSLLARFLSLPRPAPLPPPPSQPPPPPPPDPLASACSPSSSSSGSSGDDDDRKREKAGARGSSGKRVCRKLRYTGGAEEVRGRGSGRGGT